MNKFYSRYQRSLQNVLLLLSDAFDVIGGTLIYKVVEPVVEEQICVRSPSVFRLFCRVVIREVILGNVGANTLCHIALVLKLECVSLILRVT